MIYIPLFTAFFLLNVIGSIGMTYPATDPNELSVIAVAYYFAGKSWSGVMAFVEFYYGFLQGLLYMPLVLIFEDAKSQYAAMITLNSLLISFIPVIAFSLARHMNAGKMWKCFAVSLISGGFCCYFAHSKFAWTETVSVFMPWFIIWLVFKIGDVKNKNGKIFLSLLTGAACGLSFAAHSRLIAVVTALFAALLMERIFYGRKRLSFPVFILSCVLMTTVVAGVTLKIQKELWFCDDPSLLKNTLAEFLVNFPARFENGGAYRILQTLTAQLYYFSTATWGLGAVAFCLFGAVLGACVRHKVKKEQQTYEADLSLFAFFSVLTVLLTIVFGTLYRFSSDGFTVYQDTMMFGRFIDGVLPLALVFVLIMLFTHSISINKILGACAVLGVIYVLFMVFAVPTILQCTSTRISPALGLYPLRIGAASRELLDTDSFMLTISMTFCVMGALIVIISCTKKYRSLIISVIMSSLTVYSLIFISAVYLPICRSESVEKNRSVAELSESVFDQAGAPTVTAYNISRHDSLMLQFLNRHITVRMTYDIESVPENSFLAVSVNEDVSALENSRTPFLLVAKTDTLRLYAYGERAAAYMQSQDMDDSERRSQQDVLIPEKTAPAPVTIPTETTVSTKAPETSRTTERTPIFTTYTTPSLITVPVEELDPDSEWAVIE